VIMQFNPIRAKFDQWVDSQITAGTFQSIQVAEAVQGGAPRA
jgi:hypothetical protein